MVLSTYVILPPLFYKLEENEKTSSKIDIKISDSERGPYWLCSVVEKVKSIEYSRSYFTLPHIYITSKDKSH